MNVKCECEDCSHFHIVWLLPISILQTQHRSASERSSAEACTIKTECLSFITTATCELLHIHISHSHFTFHIHIHTVAFSLRSTSIAMYLIAMHLSTTLATLSALLQRGNQVAHACISTNCSTRLLTEINLSCPSRDLPETCSATAAHSGRCGILRQSRSRRRYPSFLLIHAILIHHLLILHESMLAHIYEHLFTFSRVFRSFIHCNLSRSCSVKRCEQCERFQCEM